MKKVLLTLISILSAVMLYGQTIHQQKIIDFYGQDWFTEMENINPGILLVMDRYIEFGFVVEDIVDSKYLLFDPIETVPLNDRDGQSVSISDFLNDYYGGNFNPLNYNFYPGNAIQVFRLSGVNKIIVIESQENLLNN